MGEVWIIFGATHYCLCFPYEFYRVVDVGSEWRTFSNEKSTSDPSRVGAAQVRIAVRLNNSCLTYNW